MGQWVDNVLSAYLLANPPLEGVIPVLLLDSYRCHMMASVVSRIEALGVEVIHIPGGCTGLCQPLDVGVNRAFKARVRRMWEEWLTNLLEETDTVRDATCEEVSEWMAAVYWELVGSRILRNCWHKTGFDWFPGLVDPEDVVANRNDDADGDDGNNDEDADDDDSYAYDDAIFDSDEDEEREEESDDESDD